MNLQYAPKRLIGIIFITLFSMFFVVLMGIGGTFAITQPTTPAQASSIYDATSYPGDYYAWGNCTWWVYIRRDQIGETIPNSWGNAATWATRAASMGYLVDHNPSYGAIMQIPDVDHGLGHVAFVESVEPNGTWNISEMNVEGLDIVDDKSMPAAARLDYNFIHEKVL